MTCVKYGFNCQYKMCTDMLHIDSQDEPRVDSETPGTIYTCTCSTHMHMLSHAHVYCNSVCSG